MAILEAAEQAKMSLLDFETFVLRDWAERYEQHKRGLAELRDQIDQIGVIPGGD